MIIYIYIHIYIYLYLHDMSNMQGLHQVELQTWEQQLKAWEQQQLAQQGGVA